MHAYQTAIPWPAPTTTAKAAAAATTDWFYTASNLVPALQPTAKLAAAKFAATLIECTNPVVEKVTILYACNQNFGAAVNYQLRVRNAVGFRV